MKIINIIVAIVVILTSVSAFGQAATNLLDAIQLPSTIPAYSGGSGSVSGGSFGSSYAGVQSGTINPVATFYFSSPLTVQQLTYTFYLQCSAYGNDSDNNTLSYDVQYYSNGSWIDVPNANGYMFQTQYHNELSIWFDPSEGNTTVTLSNLNLTNCSGLSISLYASSNNSKKGNCSGEAYLYVFQALMQSNSIVANPQSTNVFVGSTAQFSVGTQGGAAFSYQWLFMQN
jgi:hypothetical protein